VTNLKREKFKEALSVYKYQRYAYFQGESGSYCDTVRTYILRNRV